MDIEKLIEQLRQHGGSCVRAYGRYCSICDEAATALSTLQAENKRLRKELEYERESANAYYEECGQWEAENEKLQAKLGQVKRENNALWTYIEIVDREYRRYMDSGYSDRLDELRRTWRHGQKED